MELVNVLAKLIGISMVVAAVSCSSAVPIEEEPTRIADLAIRPEATSKLATRIPTTITQVQIRPTPDVTVRPIATSKLTTGVQIQPVYNESSTSIALFDAHNHMPKGLTAEKIISVMDQENIAK